MICICNLFFPIGWSAFLMPSYCVLMLVTSFCSSEHIISCNLLYVNNSSKAEILQCGKPLVSQINYFGPLERESSLKWMLELYLVEENLLSRRLMIYRCPQYWAAELWSWDNVLLLIKTKFTQMTTENEMKVHLKETRANVHASKEIISLGQFLYGHPKLRLVIISTLLSHRCFLGLNGWVRLDSKRDLLSWFRLFRMVPICEWDRFCRISTAWLAIIEAVS